MIFLISLLFAEEPKYKDMKTGETVPWDGRLLNEAAIRILVEDSVTKDLTCDALVEFKVNENKILEKYRYDVLKSKTDAEIEKLNELIRLHRRTKATKQYLATHRWIYRWRRNLSWNYVRS